MAKKITAKWIENDSGFIAGGRTLIVIKSDHPKYKSNTRFDLGYMELANRDGYTVTVQPLKQK